jgi:hypothetical protein
VTTHYEVLLIDEHWGAYADGYGATMAWNAIKRTVPHAECLGGSATCLLVDMGRTPPAVLHGKVRCDALYYRRDGAARLYEQLYEMTAQDIETWGAGCAAVDGEREDTLDCLYAEP